MRNIKKITFYKEKKNNKCLVYYSDGNLLDLDFNAGIYALRQFISERNYKNYYELLKDYNCYIGDDIFDNKEDILMHLFDECSDKKVTYVELENISFDSNDKSEEKLPNAKVTYRYVFNNKIIKHVKTNMSIDESIDEIVNYIKRNKITNIDDVFSNNGLCHIPFYLNDCFKKEIIPNIKIIMEKHEKDDIDTSIVKNIIQKNNCSIGRVIFYKDKEKEKAIIVYKNGKIKYVSKQEGINTIINYSKKYNIDTDELVDNTFAIKINNKDLANNLDKYINDVTISKRRKLLRVFDNKYIKSAIAILTALAVGFCVGKCGIKAYNEKNKEVKEDNKKISKVVENDIVIDEKLDNALDSIINELENDNNYNESYQYVYKR